MIVEVTGDHVADLPDPTRWRNAAVIYGVQGRMHVEGDPGCDVVEAETGLFSGNVAESPSDLPARKRRQFRGPMATDRHRVQNTYSPALSCGLMLRANVANEVSPAMSVILVQEFLLGILCR